MNFLQPLYKRSHYKCFFCGLPFKTAQLAYIDYEITLLTFRITKLKIDAYSIFVKVLSRKSYQFLLP